MTQVPSGGIALFNPQKLSRNERLAFVFKKDKPLIFWETTKRRRRNNALLVHEQILRSPSIRRELPIKVRQYSGEDRVTVLAEE